MAVPAFERANRLKPRDTSDSNQSAAAATPPPTGPSAVKWTELLEKFRATQDRARRATGRAQLGGANDDGNDAAAPTTQMDGAKDRRFQLEDAPGGAAAVGGRAFRRPGSAGVDGSAGSGGVLGRYGGGGGGGSTGGGGGGSGSGSVLGLGRVGDVGGMIGGLGGGVGNAGAGGKEASGHRSKFSASQLGRFASGVRGMGGGGKR